MRDAERIEQIQELEKEQGELFLKSLKTQLQFKNFPSIVNKEEYESIRNLYKAVNNRILSLKAKYRVKFTNSITGEVSIQELFCNIKCDINTLNMPDEINNPEVWPLVIELGDIMNHQSMELDTIEEIVRIY